MKNLISIVEIPVLDFSRAVAFYQAVFGVHIHEVDMDDTLMGVFSHEDEEMNICIIKDKNTLPSDQGVLVYFDAQDDLQPILDQIEVSGGIVLLPKTEIDPEMGFFALFLDSEGNKLGLHSQK
ncbi:VOC family protein [Porphyromonas sp.]|uniref:VOC family protein n=1 Tax=Porphyromonas sp. TaxID=1924944 RepID=UPI0026DD1384|nr:VOC family protein [Porphyromonas sp.]MDO4695640.1 VOC family protein [Porphyromonas sp.]MDO4771536.1 VOC family protein [Porphyromonas sp.]